MRIATACNLLSILNGDLSSYPSSILEIPTSIQDVRDRVNAFWSIFIADRFGTLMAGQSISGVNEV
jgi:hypothetical protein